MSERSVHALLKNRVEDRKRDRERRCESNKKNFSGRGGGKKV